MHSSFLVTKVEIVHTIMGLDFKGSDFRGRNGRSSKADVTDFITCSMHHTSRVRQFALNQDPDLIATDCTIIKGWHGDLGEPLHFTCRLEYIGHIWWSGRYLGTEMKKYGTLHVQEDGSESWRGGRIW